MSKMEDVRLVKTGIPGLDDLLRGGLPEQSITLISGPPGIGKSNMGLQFIYNGIMEYDEPGIYMSVEYSRTEVQKYCRNFGWDLNALEKANKLVVLEQTMLQSEKTGKGSERSLIDTVRRVGAKRLTLDSITLFNYMYEDDPKLRRLHLLDFMSTIKTLGLTALVISEQYGVWPNVQVDPDHFLAEGLIQLFWTTQHAVGERCIKVAKMRGQDVDTNIRPFRISNKGVEVHYTEVPFTLKNF